MSNTKDMELEEIAKTIDLNIASTTPKVKDPKKVKGGKALARKNAEARKISSQEEESAHDSSSNVDVSTIYNGILSIAGLVGAGFTLYHGWKFFETSDWSNDLLRAKFIHSKPKVEEVEKVEEVKEKLKEVKKSKSVTPLVSPSLRG